MADATGSSSGAGAGAGAATGHGDLGRGVTQGQCQVYLTSSTNRIAPNAANIYPPTHQYPIGLIPAQRPMNSSPIAAPPQQLVPPPQYHVVQSQPPPIAGRYQHQDYPAYGNTAPSTTPVGFAGWRMYSNTLMSFSQPVPLSGGGGNSNISVVNSNGFHQNSSSYATTMWTNYVPSNQPYYTNYAPAATINPVLQAPAIQNINNHQERDLGFAPSFGATAPTVPAIHYEGMPQRTTNSSTAQLFQEVKNVDSTFRTSGPGGEIEGSEASEEQDPAPELEAQNQLGQGFRDINATDNTVLNCKDYHTVLRKDLTNSDCGNIGRIVLPKRDAEANLPTLIDKDGIILEMDDLELPDVWKFKYRYWPNNKSRMYILESAGEFVKRHKLEAGDVFVIYQHKRTGRHVARAVKAIPQSSNLNLLECQCMREGRSSEECGFAVSAPPPKKT